MSDENTESQDNTDGASDDSSEGNLLTQATDTTDDASQEDNPDNAEGNTETTDGENDGSVDDGDGEADGENQKEEAPEDYADFNLPEGIEALDETMLVDALPLFKENGLSQEQAQEFINLYAKTIQGQSETRSQAFTDLNNNNIKAIKEHTEFGGDNLDGSLTHVARGIDTVMGEQAQDFRDLLDHTGLGNHPLMFELLTKVGKSIGEDGYITGGKSGGKQSQAEVMYGKDGTGAKAEA